MDNKTEKEKPNYSLHFRAQCSDDWVNCEYPFNASNDDEACGIAFYFIEEQNRIDKQEIVDGKKGQHDWCCYKPLRLERFAYVIKEVEERTIISLQGDVFSRVRSGAPVELTELVNL